MESLSTNFNFKANKNLYITGGLALATALIYVSKSIYNKFQKTELSSWLEDYISDVIEKTKENKNYGQSIDFISFVMNLSNELQSYLLKRQNPDLEEERIKNINNEKAYEELVAETVELHEKSYHEASLIIKKRTGVDLENLSQALQNFERRQIQEATRTQKKSYYDKDLPLVEVEVLKEAYIFYAKTFTQHTRIAAEQMTLAQRRPEYQEIAFKTIFQNKFLLKDLIKSKFGFDSCFFEDLIRKYGLLEDSQVKYYYEEVRNSFSF